MAETIPRVSTSAYTPVALLIGFFDYYALISIVRRHYKMRRGVCLSLSVRPSVCRVALAAAIGCTRICRRRGIPVTQSESESV